MAGVDGKVQTTEEIEEGRSVVRSFSDQWRESGTLTDVLREEVRRQERRKLYIEDVQDVM